MKETISRLKEDIESGTNVLRSLSTQQLLAKPAPGKWSKIEILGHLIDSAVNNLQRFTEVQFKPKPFRFSNYSQDELVRSNDYQNADLSELLSLWQALNHRIGVLMALQSEETLAFEVVLPNGEVSDLKFLMVDYVDHLEHHLNQIRR